MNSLRISATSHLKACMLQVERRASATLPQHHVKITQQVIKPFL